MTRPRTDLICGLDAETIDLLAGLLDGNLSPDDPRRANYSGYPQRDAALVLRAVARRMRIENPVDEPYELTLDDLRRAQLRATADPAKIPVDDF